MSDRVQLPIDLNVPDAGEVITLYNDDAYSLAGTLLQRGYINVTFRFDNSHPFVFATYVRATQNGDETLYSFQEFPASDDDVQNTVTIQLGGLQLVRFAITNGDADQTRWIAIMEGTVVNDVSQNGDSANNGNGGDVLQGSFNYSDLRLLAADENDVANCYGIIDVNDGGEGQFACNIGTSPIGDNNGTHIQGPGVYWVRCGIRALGYIDAHWFGAKIDPGDNSTDSTVAIQKAIDYSTYFSEDKLPVRLSGARYRTTNTIHLGYGDLLRSAFFEGAGLCYLGEAPFAGTTLFCDFWEGPGIAIQGGFGSVVRSLTVLGKNQNWIRSNNLSIDYNVAPPLLDDLVEANWIDPTAPAASDGRYSPYAAIVIDPYRGVSPGPGLAYPNVDYPPYDTLGGVQYGRGQSSQILIEDVMMTGFVAGLVNMPNGDGNGDYTACRRVHFAYNKYHFSIGNTQSRSVSLDDCQMVGAFINFTNMRHGLKSGKYGGHIRNVDSYSAIHWCEFGAYYASPVTFDTCYAESLYGLGNILSGQVDGSYVFRNCEFLLNLQQDERGVPASTLGSNHYLPSGGHPATLANVVIADSVFSNYPSVVGFDQAPNLDGSFFRKDERTTLYEKFAHNLLCGGCVTPRLQSNRIGRLKSRIFNLNTGDVDGIGYTNIWDRSERKNCIPLAAMWVHGSEPDGSDLLLNPGNTRKYIDKAALASCTLVNKTLTINFTFRPLWLSLHEGGAPGDVIWDDVTGSVFFIRSLSGTTLIAELQNNYKSDGAGGFTQLTAMPTDVGNFYFGISRYYTPSRYLRGDVSNASNVITNCGQDDDYADFINAQIAQFDEVVVEPTQDNWTPISQATIMGRDQTAKTITLLGTPNYTQSRRRLAFFLRQPPANS